MNWGRLYFGLIVISAGAILLLGAAGTGLSRYLTVHGLVHHTVYHAGQIALLRRALEE